MCEMGVSITSTGGPVGASDPIGSAIVGGRTHSAPHNGGAFARFYGGAKPPSNIRNLLEQGITTANEELLRFLIDDIFEQPFLHKLKLKHQSPSLHYTSLGRDEQGRVRSGLYDTNRWTHSRDVAHLAIDFAKKENFSFHQALVASLVGALHDLGHPAFSHSGEEVIHAMGFPEFDHDLFTAILASLPDVKAWFDELGYPDLHKEVLAGLLGRPILEEKRWDRMVLMREKLAKIGLPHMLAIDPAGEDRDLIFKWSEISRLVQDRLDMIAYRARDTKQSDADIAKLEKILRYCFGHLDALTFTEEGLLALHTAEDMDKFFLAMNDHAKKRITGPQAGLFAGEILEGTRERKLSPYDLITGADEDVLDLLEPGSAARVRTGVDRHYRFLFQIRPPFRANLSRGAYQRRLEDPDFLDIKFKLDQRAQRLSESGALPAGAVPMNCIIPRLVKKEHTPLIGAALERAVQWVGSDEGEVTLNRPDDPKYGDDFIATRFQLSNDRSPSGKPLKVGTFILDSDQGIACAIRLGDLQAPEKSFAQIKTEMERELREILEEKGLSGYFEWRKVMPFAAL